MSIRTGAKKVLDLQRVTAALMSAALLFAPVGGWAQQKPQPTDSRTAADVGTAGVRNDLLTLYREALSNDAVLASARALQLATQERVPQARAALLPNIGASARHDYNLYRSSTPGLGSTSSNYSVIGGGLDLTVPIYRPQNLTALDQARLTVIQSEAQLAQSQQDVALRVANAYFNVLAARDQLIALVASKQATGEQLQQARREFEVGTKTIIDTNEAQARFDQITAQEQVALGALLVRRSELQIIIAREPDTLAPLRERPTLSAPLPQDINTWVRAAEDGSYSVQIARTGYEIASREIQRQRDAYKPTVDLISGYNLNRFNGTQGSDTNPRINSGSVGVVLNVPLYTGGLIQSRVREALALQERSNFDLESARRTAANAARDAYTGVNFGLAQVSALESAEVSARTQLESTQLGYEVGVRIQLDVLYATTQLVQTQRDLKRARYDVLLAGLRLKQAAGTLGDADIAAVNALLDPAEPITVPDVPAVNVRSPQRSTSPVLEPPATTPPAPTTRPRGTTSTPRVNDRPTPLSPAPTRPVQSNPPPTPPR
ncbi:MAG TPA: TolC family outer membrane protein [Burkholderiaceae bacterium]|nr:TolC family outer membrane protein [Burkholderiaceae bacterium]